MMKKIAAPLLALLILLPGCLKDPDPIPVTINTYQTYYHFFAEPYALQWEIDEVLIGSGHSYGLPGRAMFLLDSATQKVLIQTRESGTSSLIDSISCLMQENGSYMVALLGDETAPHLLCEPVDTHIPSIGMCKLRFLHTASDMGPVDIYIGGELSEDKMLSGTSYTDLTDYIEITEDKLWTSVIVAPENSLPADSTILSYTANVIFRTGRGYLVMIAHETNSTESAYQLQVDEQSIY